MDYNAGPTINVSLRHSLTLIFFTAIGFYLYGLSKAKKRKEKREERKSMKCYQNASTQTLNNDKAELLKRDREVLLKDAQINDLKKLIANGNQQHGMIISEMKKSKNKEISVLHQKIEKLELMNAFRGNLRKIDEEIMNKEAESLQQVKAKYEKIEAERDKLLSHGQATAVKFKELEKNQIAQIMQLSERLKAMKQELGNKESENSQLQTEILKLRANINSFEEIVESNRSDLSSKESNMKQLKAEFDTKMLESATTKDALMIDLKMAQKKIAHLMLQMEAYIQRISKMEQLIVDNRQEHENEMAETKRMHNEQIQMREQQISQKNDSLKEMTHCMNEAIAATNAEMKNMEAQNECDAMRIDEQTKSLSAKNIKIKQLKQLLNEIIEKYKIITAQRDKLISSMDKMKSEITKYKKDKEVKIKESVHLQSQMNVLRIQFAVKEKKVKQLEMERIKYLNDTQIKSVMSEQRLIQTIHKLEYELKELATEYDALRQVYDKQQIPISKQRNSRNQKMKGIEQLLSDCETEAQRENKKYTKNIWPGKWSIFS